ncbi:MAG: carotenoid oxygenase family protein [Granulosicoccus sp.]
MNNKNFSGNTSPYLQGNFAPVLEEITVDNLKVIGHLPRDLNGLYVRNGPNPRLPPKGSYHWFDGDGMIHGVHFEDGRASYRNRFIATAGFLHEKKKGRAVWNGLTGFPSARQMLFPPAGLRAKNVANTSLVWHEGRLLALWEVGEPHVIDVPGLETLGHLDTGLKCKAFTAHPKVDSASGEMVFFGMQMGPRPSLHYGVADRQGQLSYSIRIPLRDSVFMHDFAITANYTLFMDLPYLFSLKSMVTKGVPFTFKQSQPSRFGIMPRFGTANDIVWFEDDPCFVFHTLNAYELLDDAGSVEEIILVACRMKRGTIAALPGHTKSASNKDATRKLPLSLNDAARLHEWRFNMKTGKVKSTQLDDRASDFPRFNEHLMGAQNQFGYVASVQVNENNGAPEFTEIIKHDLKTGSMLTRPYGSGHFAGEAVFVPRSRKSSHGASEQVMDNSEDDGWLLSHVFDAQSESSELLVIDASTLDAEPVARIRLPQRVPYGFHGTWIPADTVECLVAADGLSVTDRKK